MKICIVKMQIFLYTDNELVMFIKEASCEGLFGQLLL